MKVIKSSFLVLALVTATIFLSGCTPEKAESLVTAVKSFESKSLQAIDAYEKMFKTYRIIDRETNDQLFEQTVAVIKKGTPSSVNIDSMVEALSLRKANKGDSTIEKEFYDIKVVYTLLRNAYESLPKGSILGAEYVSCGQDVVAKATSQLVNFSMDIQKDPLYPISLRQKVGKYKYLVKNNKDKEARLVFNEIATAINNYDTQHENAIKLTLAAVEDGKKVHQLLGKYGEVSISEILGVVQFGLDFLRTLKGIDVEDATAKLQSVQKELGDKEYWKRIETMPIAEVGNCKIETSSNGE